MRKLAMAERDRGAYSGHRGRGIPDAARMRATLPGRGSGSPCAP